MRAWGRSGAGLSCLKRWPGDTWAWRRWAQSGKVGSDRGGVGRGRKPGYSCDKTGRRRGWLGLRSAHPGQRDNPKRRPELLLLGPQARGFKVLATSNPWPSSPIQHLPACGFAVQAHQTLGCRSQEMPLIELQRLIRLTAWPGFTLSFFIAGLEGLSVWVCPGSGEMRRIWGRRRASMGEGLGQATGGISG